MSILLKIYKIYLSYRIHLSTVPSFVCQNHFIIKDLTICKILWDENSIFCCI